MGQGPGRQGDESKNDETKPIWDAASKTINGAGTLFGQAPERTSAAKRSQIVKEHESGAGRQRVENKNDETNQFGTQLPLNQRAAGLVNRWTSSLRRAEA
jgi:hypothetical protein